MEPEQFYENLRSDKEKVETIVNELKAGGFEVYAAGSALIHPNYDDIDLVVKPQEGMTLGDIRSQLEVAVGSLEGQGVSREVDRSRSSLSPEEQEVHDLLERLSYGPMPPLDSKDSDSKTYVQSKIMERYRLNIGGTKIDISVFEAPFALSPGTDYVEL